MSRRSAYLETTILSFASGRVSSNLVTAGKQLYTQTWIEPFLLVYACYVSDAVVEESRRGDVEAAGRREALLRRMRVLEVNEAAEKLAFALIQSRAIPAKAATDALHVATAAVHAMDYLVTWNCKHISNATMRPRIEEACRRQGYRCPVICTPMELEVTRD